MKRVAAIFFCIITALLLFPGKARSEDTAIRVPVIPAEFSDLSLRSSQERLDSLMGELKKYYEAQFLGKTSFEFTVLPTVNLNRPYAYYGANTTNRRDALIARLASTVLKESDRQNDFSSFDSDGKGNFKPIIIVAGPSESEGAGMDYFWPQTLNLEEDNIHISLDGKKIDEYSIVPEMKSGDIPAGIGTLAHEFGHLLGLQDMYDTDGEASGGLCHGLAGSTALMDLGNKNDEGLTPPNLNAIDRHLLGIGECIPLVASGSYSLEPIDIYGRYYLLPTSEDDKYYLIENRQDKGYDAFIGGSGMLVYRVDRRDADAGYSSFFQRTVTALERWRHNQVNCNPEFSCAALEKPFPDSLDARYAFWPQEGKKVFAPSPKALTDIKKMPDGTITFDLAEPIVLDAVSPFQNSAIIAWTVSDKIAALDSCKLEWSVDGKILGRVDGELSSDRQYSYTINGLHPRTKYNFEVLAYCSDGSVFHLGGVFETRIYRGRVFPFIFLANTSRNADGSFKAGASIPLIVYNLIGNSDTQWLFNGKEIRAGRNGTWEIPGNGTLEAIITNQDGVRTIITKEIIVR